MREIKFRYVYKNTRTDEIKMAIHTLESIERSRPSPADSPMGYVLIARNLSTGLMDKQGTEIYEGDIYCRMDSLYAVEWHGFIAGYYSRGINVSSNCYEPTQGDAALMWEVVGNIYENPELLEEVKNASA